MPSDFEVAGALHKLALGCHKRMLWIHDYIEHGVRDESGALYIPADGRRRFFVSIQRWHNPDVLAATVFRHMRYLHAAIGFLDAHVGVLDRFDSIDEHPVQLHTQWGASTHHAVYSHVHRNLCYAAAQEEPGVAYIRTEDWHASIEKVRAYAVQEDLRKAKHWLGPDDDELSYLNEIYGPAENACVSYLDRLLKLFEYGHDDEQRYVASLKSEWNRVRRKLCREGFGKTPPTGGGAVTPEQPEADPTRASAADNGTYVFRRVGDTWSIAFGDASGEGIIGNKGFPDIQYLIAMQGQDVELEDLPGNKGGRLQTGRVDAAPREQRGELERQIREIASGLPEPADGEVLPADKQAEREEGISEIEALRRQMGQNFGKLGNPRQLPSDLDKMRGATRKRIQRGCNEIFEKVSAALHDHLLKNISIDSSCSYDPGVHLPWDVGD